MERKIRKYRKFFQFNVVFSRAILGLDLAYFAFNFNNYNIKNNFLTTDM